MTVATRLSRLTCIGILAAATLAGCAAEPNDDTCSAAGRNARQGQPAGSLSGAQILKADACDPLDLLNLSRTWHFGTFPRDGGPEVLGPLDGQDGGDVHKFHDYGALSLGPDDSDPRADSEVFSSADGFTYYVSTEGAPLGRGSNVELQQLMSFKKNAPNASLVFTVTGIELEAIDDNFDDNTCAEDFCAPTLNTGVEWEIIAYNDSTTLFHGQSSVDLFNPEGKWARQVGGRTTRTPFWALKDFVTNFSDNDEFLARPAVVKLAHSIPIPVDISLVADSAEFTVLVVVTAKTENLAGRESYLSAYFRDPASIGGSMIEFTGLEPTNRPLPRPPLGTFGAAPACTTPNPGAGVLQFAAAAFETSESPFNIDPITVSRTGGTSGPVSATITTRDGSAVAGRDYVAVTTTVAFADGDDQPRTVTVPLLLNTLPEASRSVFLSLSEPGGCATLGASSSVLTIHDDDTPIVPIGFSIGGAVTGLTGSGLTLRNLNTAEILPVANGTFAFNQLSPDGLAYDVTVATQPTNPAQVCTVTGGSGMVTGADITNIAVNCITPTGGGMDPSFSGDGKVQTPLSGATGGAVALQSDGSIVVAGSADAAGSIDFALLRYTPGGALDPTFGAGGTVTTGFVPNSRDEGLDVVVQTDGKIVVVGRTAAVAVDFDFAIARYKTDGSLDSTFGSNGRVVTDFGPGPATARAVALLPDGRILAVGEVGGDFALARYLTNGGPDPTFGSGGKTTVDITGGDIANGVALLGDGRFVVAGGAATSIERDFGVVRFKENGSVDSTFGTNGLVTTDFGGLDQAFDVVIEPTGKIVAAGSIDGGGAQGVDFALARYNSDGSPDFGFSGDGKVTTNFSAGRDRGAALIRQADGKLIVAGLTTSGSFAFNHFALARYLTDGRLDTSFGVGGTLAIDIDGGHSNAAGLAIQADGKIVAAGGTSFGAGGTGFAVVRLLP